MRKLANSRGLVGLYHAASSDVPVNTLSDRKPFSLVSIQIYLLGARNPLRWQNHEPKLDSGKQRVIYFQLFSFLFVGGLPFKTTMS